MMRPPESVIPLLRRLELHGFQAVVAGGFVRDSLLGLPPGDLDVATSALPQEVEHIFGSNAVSISSSRKHGTIIVTGFGPPVEVTTFRRESGYSDHRRPDRVDFVRDIREDCSRRDFTINAMMLDADGRLYDFFGGRADLDKRLIRAVGEPERRFSEDALRMLRALRFAARLGFSIEPDTLSALWKCAPLCRFLAAERVFHELSGILLSPRPQYAVRAGQYGLLDHFLSHRPKTVFSRLDALPAELPVRFAAFCSLLKAEGCITCCESFVRRLRASSELIKLCSCLDRFLSSDPPASRSDIKRLMCLVGIPFARGLAAAWFSIGKGNLLPQIDNILSSGECFSADTLALGGRDLLALGLSGRDVGRAIGLLLAHVSQHPEDNTRERLIALLDTLTSAQEEL